jgi:hypothetical protein
VIKTRICVSRKSGGGSSRDFAEQNRGRRVSRMGNCRRQFPMRASGPRQGLQRKARPPRRMSGAEEAPKKIITAPYGVLDISVNLLQIPEPDNVGLL